MHRLMLAIFTALGLTIAQAQAAQAATVLINGANRGIGLEFAKQYAGAGWTVIATARNPDQAKDLNALAAKHPNLSVRKLDIVDAGQVAALARDLKGQPIDVLLNNAGVLGDLKTQALGAFDYANFQQVMGANVFGALAVSEALRDNVAASAQKKIVTITSGIGAITRRVGPTSLYFYGISKAAVNKGMQNMAADLNPRGIIVALMSPGTVETDMRHQLVGDLAAKDERPEIAIASMRKVIEGMTLANTAKPLSYDGKEQPW